jgi:hypothetical protein
MKCISFVRGMLILAGLSTLGMPAFAGDPDKECIKAGGHILSDCIKGNAKECNKAIDRFVDHCIGGGGKGGGNGGNTGGKNNGGHAKEP